MFPPIDNIIGYPMSAQDTNISSNIFAQYQANLIF